MDEQEFNRVLLTVVLSGVALFAFAAGVLGFFMRGLGREDRGIKGARESHRWRFAALIGVLLAISLYFFWLAYRG